MFEVLRNPYIVGLVALTIVNTILIVWVIMKFRQYFARQQELLRGEEVPDIERIVLRQKKQLATHKKNLKELGEILEELVENNKLNIQKIGLVRFNPFEDAGGNLSFALALLDRHGTGFVISSLHNREGTRIYAKEVEHSTAKQHLTDEEQQAIKKAQQSRVT